MFQLEDQSGPLGQWRVEAVCNGGAFAAMRPQWNALLEQSRAAVFCSWEWLYPWYRRLGADRRPRVLVATDRDGALRGILPMSEYTQRAFGRTVRRWSFLGDAGVGSDGLDVVCARGREEEAADAFSAHLSERRAEWDVLECADLPADSPTVAALERTFAGSHMFEVVPRFICPWTELPVGESFDAFLRRTGRRDNFLRRLKWLRGQPGYRLERSERPGALAPALSEFFRLHSMRWSSSGGSDGIQGARVEAFHRDAVELLSERGKARLYTMWVGDQPVASVYGLVHGRQFIYFQAGYDPAYASRSVGLVLVGETFRDAIESGCQAYDFLRGTEPYKADWVSSARRTVTVRVAQRGAGAWWWRRQQVRRSVRGVAKRALPSRWVEWIRQRRRRVGTARA